MGKEKHGFLTPKAISNRIKAKGLQKLRWFCQMCEKQCRDENGFKCHMTSESHQRQLLLVAENPGLFVSNFSREFRTTFLHVLKRSFGTKRVKANTVYQQYISDRQHLHMNATQWTTLTRFIYHLGKSGFCKVDETERGTYITYIDRDPETLEREARARKKDKMEIDDCEIQMRMIKQQIERDKNKRDAVGDVSGQESLDEDTASEKSTCHEQLADNDGDISSAQHLIDVSKLSNNCSPLDQLSHDLENDKNTVSNRDVAMLPGDVKNEVRKIKKAKRLLLGAIQPRTDGEKVTISFKKIPKMNEPPPQITAKPDPLFAHKKASAAADKVVFNGLNPLKSPGMTLDPSKIKREPADKVFNFNGLNPSKSSGMTLDPSKIKRAHPNVERNKKRLYIPDEERMDKRNKRDHPEFLIKHFKSKYEWCIPGIVVKILKKTIPETLAFKATISDVKSTISSGVCYTIIHFLRPGTTIELDSIELKENILDPNVKFTQAELETVIPNMGRRVFVLNGPYRGSLGSMKGLDEHAFCAKIELDEIAENSCGTVEINMSYEDICKVDEKFLNNSTTS